MRCVWVQCAVALACAAVVSNFPALGADVSSWRISPSAVFLDSPESTQQLLITSVKGERAEDLTRLVSYESADSKIAVVTPEGRILPRGEGVTEILIQHEETGTRVPVEIRGLTSPAPVSFRYEVLPILSKAGCNSGGCHGKAEGQNGFKLSIFGFDPETDHEALAKQGRARRVSLVAPRNSLLLRKATGETPHGGGGRIEKDSLWYRRIERWVAEGARLDDEFAPRVTSIEVEPAQIMMSPMATQQLRVTAIDSTGLRRCVTVEAEYKSNAVIIADADPGGVITASNVPGEAAILVRYMELVGVCRVTLPQPGVTFTRPPEYNFIDRFAWDKLQRLGIEPSELADDATFLRRAYLDTIGTLPTADETREFLSDNSTGNRSKLIEHLLQRKEYADYQAMRWADILRVDQSIVTPQGALAMTRWLRQQFQQNTPYDEFAWAILTAKGNTFAESPAAFYQVHKDPEMLSRSISQIFLGVRIECAQCHHHPFERWSQQDYFALAGFFTGVGRKQAATGGQKIFPQAGIDLNHPRTQQPVAAAGLGAEPADTFQALDRRTLLAEWVTSPDNPFFARMMANRLWGQYFGRGLVEPLDDLRATNPATNEPLLDALAAHLVDVKFDLKALTRTMLNSRLYQLASQPNEFNESDQQNYSHATWKALPAEVLLDAICQSTAVSEQFNGWPDGYRAIHIWDNRMPSYFFRIFGKPQRVSVCECERGNEPSIAQALHLMNSLETVHKIRNRDGRAARLATSELTDGQVIEELYLATLSRFPSDKEVALMRQAFAESNGNRRAAVEDILWALLNTREFVYNH
ncbi:MAG: DUF1549 and DUF1553 domain-containing protein [Planctomycetaceae bacterium]|jgi:hypothetical protein|nr:DUF1549 and DUF1553 domain-containing protein [Planctomycetaceae bacterium]MDG2388505.1 DUF1549 and DUF1553 domain-containing protein [Planctomycetaceae bacterium]